ncbi:hypothetical protein [Elioraea sp.]|uniref:hypothetical protein n=1 Tax=Elioraea sp. TaxID=2185103 RepID=UPI003F6E857E
MITHVVDTDGLNLRSSPGKASDNGMHVLARGHGVTFLALAELPGWWKVATRVNGGPVEGFVAAAHLRKVDPGVPPPATADLPAALLERDGRPVTRNARQWPFVLNEPGMPRRLPGSTDPAADITAILEWLDVERQDHVRWRPEPGGKTFCNVYAHDVCHLAGAYLPRVWWTKPALRDLAAGRPVKASLGPSTATVTEVTANTLRGWLAETGPRFGWRETGSLDEAQAAANAGRIVVRCGQTRSGSPGHITIIVPETPQHQARRDGAGTVTVPLQSQAGRDNRRYLTEAWWTGPTWLAVGTWIGP